jgi:hypothetical protein
VQLRASMSKSLALKDSMHCLKLRLTLTAAVLTKYSPAQNILPCNLDPPPVHVDLRTNGERSQPKLSNFILPKNQMSAFQ